VLATPARREGVRFARLDHGDIGFRDPCLLCQATDAGVEVGVLPGCDAVGTGRPQCDPFPETVLEADRHQRSRENEEETAERKREGGDEPGVDEYEARERPGHPESQTPVGLPAHLVRDDGHHPLENVAELSLLSLLLTQNGRSGPQAPDTSSETASYRSGPVKRTSPTSETA
jgi:hypothetical protein